MRNHYTRIQKQFLAILICFFAAFAIFIGSQLIKPVAVEADFTELESRLKEAGFTQGLEPGTDMTLKNHFGLLSTDCAQVVFFAPIDFMDITEILVVEPVNPSQIPDIAEGMKKRIERQKATFENYGTDQFSVLQSAVVYSNDRYVCCVTGKQTAEVLRLIKDTIER